MAAESTMAGDEAVTGEQYETLVRDRLEFGANEEEVVAQLVGFGMTPPRARAMVDRMAKQVTPRFGAGRARTTPGAASSGKATQTRSARYPQASDGSVTMAIVGAFAAALMGGIVWGLVAKFTGYEIGFIAWGIGAAVGYGALMFSQGARGSDVQIAAVAASVFGIFFGKYLTFIVIWNEYMVEDLGGGGGLEQLTVTSGLSLYLQNIGAMLGLLDVLWIFLAVSTAWKLVGEAQD
ncbi:MAG: hypothetical protein ACR2RL_07260 [Gammaproteobacteria bacterium]